MNAIWRWQMLKTIEEKTLSHNKEIMQRDKKNNS
jgi:hypothetical protein